MSRLLKSEFLKYRRTLTRKLIFFSPLFFVLLALLQKLFMPANDLRPGELLIAMIYNWWPVLFVPIGMAIFASLIELQEKRAGNYRSLKARHISPVAIWVSKIFVMAIHLLFTTVILILATFLSGIIIAGGNIPLDNVFVAGFVVWITSLALIPLQLWVANGLGTVASIVMGVMGLVLGVIAAPSSYWIYIPWSWSTRLMSPIIGVHPNGTILEPTSPLHDSSVILIGIIISLTTTVIVSWMTAKWFYHREVQS